MNELMINAIFGTTAKNKWEAIKKSLVKDLQDLKNENELINLYQKHHIYIYSDGALTTISKRITNYRNEIKKVDFELQDRALELFKLSKEVYAYIKKESDNKLKNKISNFTEFDGDNYIDMVNNLDEVIHLNNKQFENWYITNIGSIHHMRTIEQVRAYINAIFIAMTTGARQTEILKTLEVKKHKENVILNGVLKKKNDNKKREFKSDFLLADIKSIQKAIRDLRKYDNMEEMSNEEINKKKNRNYNMELKKVLKNDDLTYKNIRAMWAEKVFNNQFKNKKYSNVERMEFKKEILGHDWKEHLTQTDNYEDVKEIQKDKPKEDKNIESNIIEKDIKDIQKDT